MAFGTVLANCSTTGALFGAAKIPVHELASAFLNNSVNILAVYNIALELLLATFFKTISVFDELLI